MNINHGKYRGVLLVRPAQIQVSLIRSYIQSFLNEQVRVHLTDIQESQLKAVVMIQTRDGGFHGHEGTPEGTPSSLDGLSWKIQLAMKIDMLHYMI